MLLLILTASTVASAAGRSDGPRSDGLRLPRFTAFQPPLHPASIPALPNTRRSSVLRASSTNSNGTYHHGPYIAHHQGLWVVNWLNSARDEDGSGERILYSVSSDSVSWSAPRVMFDRVAPVRSSAPGTNGSVIKQRPFASINGRLYAVADVYFVQHATPDFHRAVAPVMVEIFPSGRCGDVFWLVDGPPPQVYLWRGWKAFGDVSAAVQADARRYLSQGLAVSPVGTVNASRNPDFVEEWSVWNPSAASRASRRLHRGHGAGAAHTLRWHCMHRPWTGRAQRQEILGALGLRVLAKPRRRLWWRKAGPAAIHRSRRYRLPTTAAPGRHPVRVERPRSDRHPERSALLHWEPT
jgi:hypothetical protein